MESGKKFATKIIELNIAVLLISTSAPLGRFITLDPTFTIFYRTLFAAIVFYAFCRFKKFNLNFDSKKDLFKVLISGVLMGAHWVTYFYALHYSNVAVGILSVFTYPVITAFLEPIILKSKFSKVHLALGLLVLFGIYFLVPEVNFENDFTLAVCMGIISAFFYSIRNIIMKREIEKYNGSVLMLYQICVVAIVLSPILFYSEFDKVGAQLVPLLVLAVLTTCLGHTLFLMSFRNFSITAASIMSSIQPVYAIILGMIFLGEFPAAKTVIGGVFILSAVAVESFRTMKKQ